jgi:xylan 1,4-beta-xylosidase
MRFTHLAVSLGLLLWSLPLHAADEILVDSSQTAGVLRPLHGVNSGPLCAGDTLDLSAYHRQAGFPLVRLHDCHWPNADVVDIHVIFPDFLADPRLPQSYDFRRTDDYLRSILATGAKIVFRLGESIEHTKRKYHVHPPADPDKWADICLGIVRHYNDGWADGFRHDIRYWEIWNEP